MDRKLNLIYFYQYFGTPKGNWSTRVYEMTRRWVDEGHNVTVVTAPYEKSDISATKFIERQNIDGINLIIINIQDSNRNSIIKRVINALLFATISIYYALSQKYNVLIASSGPITIALPLLFAKWLRRKKTVFEVRDLWPAGGIEMGLITKKWQQKVALSFEKLIYKNTDVLFCASPGQRDYIIERNPTLDNLVVPNASDVELFSNSELINKELPAWTKGKKIFTHIGSLGLIHYCRLQVKAMKYLSEKGGYDDICLVFIGDGRDRDELEAFVAEHQLENVKFLGLKPKMELPAWVGASVATVFTTLDNEVQQTCSPNKIFDSFAASRPIIQNSTGWIKDMVEDSNCGINIEPHDHQGLAEAMIKLVEDPALRSEMCDNAFKIASTDYNRSIITKNAIEKISKLV